MKTKITVLCENSVRVPLPLIAEHGLSMLIEKEDTTLFDTGQGFGIVNNLKAMGKDPAQIARVILSHGHYDHTGGLMPFLQMRGTAVPVHAHEDAFVERIALTPAVGTPTERTIGMKATRAEYEKAGAVFWPVKGFQKICESIYALTEVKRPAGWKGWDARLKQKINRKLIDDPFDDDCSLLVETDSGPVVLLGCAHAGIIEILSDLAEKSGHREFHAVIGGTHLESAPIEYVDRAIDALKSYGVQKVAAFHCTGFDVSCRLSMEFKNKFTAACVGSVFEF